MIVMMIVSITLAAVGFCASLYAYFIERKIREKPDYKPVCDISDRISCTKPILSEYSNLFFFSNGLMGALFYAVIAALAFTDSFRLMMIATSVRLVATCFLAYLLYFKIRSLCLVCTLIYIINILLFLLAVKVFYQ